MKHTVLGLLMLTLLSACGGEKEEPACCAITPQAKCEGDLLGAGVTRDELKILTGPDAVCPNPKMSEARLREITGKWPDDCRRGVRPDPLRALDGGQCAGYVPAPSPPALVLDLPPGVSAIAMAQCASGLNSRGAKPNEIELMTKPADAFCPNNGVSEARIREIIAKDWEAAGCNHYTRAQALHALDTGACGGDAG